MLLAGTGNTGEGLGGESKIADLKAEHAIELCTGREWTIIWKVAWPYREGQDMGASVPEKGHHCDGIPCTETAGRERLGEEGGILSSNKEEEELEAAKEPENPHRAEEGVGTVQCIKQSA